MARLLQHGAGTLAPSRRRVKPGKPQANNRAAQLRRGRRPGTTQAGKCELGARALRGRTEAADSDHPRSRKLEVQRAGMGQIAGPEVRVLGEFLGDDLDARLREAYRVRSLAVATGTTGFEPRAAAGVT